MPSMTPDNDGLNDVGTDRNLAVNRVPVFFSYSRPEFPYQESFLELVLQFLRGCRGFETRALGLDLDQPNDPLSQIIRTVDSSCGLIALAFRRNLIGQGRLRIVDSAGGVSFRTLSNEWLTSSYCHIEVALAYRASLPLLILQERDVVSEGVLDRSSTGAAIEMIDRDSLPLTPAQLQDSPVGRRLVLWLQEAQTFAAPSGALK